ncbi:MAG: hypothetical protein CEE41_04425 [Hadesarchaea archaeon B3_Hades]|nr:MAG: hypothetical protein CEE41_04315 [Hadesarchaea archaeon B3_Hades]TKJ25425.1 MAG: hypothetical protein CEE41_04425 [Hadesarchaea archaeon B3_Hades]
MAEMKVIPLDHLIIPEVRASSRLTPEQAEFFEATVEEFGIIQDPVVRALDDGFYELVAGRTRILALAEGGAREAQVKVIEADEDTALFMHLAENVARGSVDPVSVAKVIDKLMVLAIPVSEIARKLGRSETWVRRTHQLLDLPEGYQAAVADGQLTPTHIQIALQMPTPYEVDQALQTTIRLGWNTPILKTYVENRLAQIQAAKIAARDSGAPLEVPAPDPQRLIQYKMCLLCGYQVPSDQIQVQLVCDHCRDLVKYVTSQAGPPEEAIETVYSALLALHQAPPRAGPPTPPTREEPGPR